jgi:hypothetical protein
MSQPFNIECNWDSDYICKKCGGLIYYDLNTRQEFCFNRECQNYPTSIDIFSTTDVDLTVLNAQLANIEKGLGQIINTCDFEYLSFILLERRRRVVEKFFTNHMMQISDFLFSNEILLFVQKYKSLGIRKQPLILKTILQMFRQYSEQLKLIEDLKEGRYLLARTPANMIFKMKYYDVIISEIWASYGLVDTKTKIDINGFRYHEVIQKIVSSKTAIISTEYAQYFDKLWPFVIGTQYLTKMDYSTSLKYKYSVTPSDLANILSIILSLQDNKLHKLPLFDLLKHFVHQPIRDKNITQFLNLLSGNKEKIPAAFLIDGNIILDRMTLLLFFMLMYGQHQSSVLDISGQQRITQFKQEAAAEYERYIRDKLQNNGYSCLPPSTSIGGRDYDVVAVSEIKLEVLLIEVKFKDPAPSSFSKSNLIEQELTYDKNGLLPQVIGQQERYDLFYKKCDLFQKKIGLKQSVSNYSVKAYFITKYIPLIKVYGNVQIMSEMEFTNKINIDKTH